MKMLPTTRQAVQATVAVGAVCTLSAIFPELERPYWATITALVVLCQTWSESMKKAAQRVAATFLGLLAAVVLYWIFRPWVAAEIVVIFVCVFFFAYSVTSSYLWAIFWMSIVVVMMFDMLGAVDSGLILARMYETLLGASMAVLVSAVVFPVRTRDQLRSDVPSLLKLLRETCVLVMDAAAGGGSRAHERMSAEVVNSFQGVRDEFRTRLRESFLLRREPSRLQKWVFWIEMLVFYTSDMQQAVERGYDAELAARIGGELHSMRDRIAHALDQLAERHSREEPIVVAPIGELLDSIREKVAPFLTGGAEGRRSCVRYFPILYYVVKIHGVLESMAADSNAQT